MLRNFQVFLLLDLLISALSSQVTTSPIVQTQTFGNDGNRTITSFRLPGKNPEPLKDTPPAWLISQMHIERLPCNQLNWQNWDGMEAWSLGGMVLFALPTNLSLSQLWAFSLSLYQFSPHPPGRNKWGWAVSWALISKTHQALRLDKQKSKVFCDSVKVHDPKKSSNYVIAYNIAYNLLLICYVIAYNIAIQCVAAKPFNFIFVSAPFIFKSLKLLAFK